MSVTERLWSRVEQFAECWEFTGANNGTGYGVISVNGRMVVAHRVAYEEMITEVPAGLMIDHLCRNRRCVNPWHLEPVTNRENARRGAKSFDLTGACMSGRHVATPENVRLRTDGRRRCIACDRERIARMPEAMRTLMRAKNTELKRKERARKREND